VLLVQSASLCSTGTTLQTQPLKLAIAINPLNVMSKRMVRRDDG